MQTITPDAAIQPGQRYLTMFPGEPTIDSEVTVDRVVRDALGMYHVILVDLIGREISLFVDQFEAAVEGGELTSLEMRERVPA
jgi:hypothetical protein